MTTVTTSQHRLRANFSISSFYHGNDYNNYKRFFARPAAVFCCCCCSHHPTRRLYISVVSRTPENQADEKILLCNIRYC